MSCSLKPSTTLRTFTLLSEPAAVLVGEEELPAEISNDTLGFGLLTDKHLNALLGDVPRTAGCYCCGPIGFMRHVNVLLLTLGFERRHFEVFGPAQDLDERTF